MSTMETLGNDTVSNKTGEVSIVINRPFHMSVAYVMIGCFGVLGNFAVILILGSSKSIRKKQTNMFILNQSSLDLFFLLAYIM